MFVIKSAKKFYFVSHGSESHDDKGNNTDNCDEVTDNNDSCNYLMSITAIVVISLTQVPLTASMAHDLPDTQSALSWWQDLRECPGASCPEGL